MKMQKDNHKITQISTNLSKKENFTKETGFFLNNANSSRVRSTNIWNSKEELTYIYDEETYTNY